MQQSVLKTETIDHLFEDPFGKFKNMLSGDNQSKNEKEKQFERKVFKNQVENSENRVCLNKLMLVLKLRLVQGHNLILLLLETITLQKKILTAEIEVGRESVIPKKLLIDADTIPQSFQYYDWIHLIIQSKMGDVFKYKVIQAKRQ